MAATAYDIRRSPPFEGLPEAAEKVRLKLQELRESPGGSTTALGKIQNAAKEIEKTAAEATATNRAASRRGVTRVQIDERAFHANDYLWSGSLGLLQAIGQAVMVAFLVFFCWLG